MTTLSAPVSLLSWRAFDQLLRGGMSSIERVKLLLSWIAWQVLCAAVFGLSLGVYGLTAREVPDGRFMLAAAAKMPLLLLLTSSIACPSLYVFGALRGLRFSAREFAAMLMVAHTILAAVLASLAPVHAFFALTTSSYSFMILLTVAACAVAGLMGIRVFVRTINEPPAHPVELGGDPAEATPASGRRTIWQLLGWWVVLYAFVGTQMGWMLRPFIGAPEMPFALFRNRGGSLIESVIFHLHHLMGG